ncbi:CAP domain-containing protein [Shimia thalassica]|uniref:CAP domain-containing protein n=1 Tax=Shimia thalassica TaxID=1715693 RepID=UPI0026E38E00|nr:CAP domain-containing protein [Shimia thalassica]MDO6484886.1 CAP domain-containing protein [Shimia thalassica]
MTRFIALALAATLALAGCDTTGAGGSSGAKQYRISSSNTSKVQFRVLDSVNALRGASGAAALQFNAQLNAAAATHSRDMAIQNRPWHFGSDGSSPIQRVQRVGYTGRFLGEAISETYETEMQTLEAWLQQEDTKAVLMNAEAQDVGFAWFQEKSGKIWWTFITGTQGSAPQVQSSAPAAVSAGVAPPPPAEG